MRVNQAVRVPPRRAQPARLEAEKPQSPAPPPLQPPPPESARLDRLSENAVIPGIGSLCPPIWSGGSSYAPVGAPLPPAASADRRDSFPRTAPPRSAPPSTNWRPSASQFYSIPLSHHRSTLSAALR